MYNRVEWCTKFAKSMCKQSRDDLIAVRAKKPMEMCKLKVALSS